MLFIIVTIFVLGSVQIVVIICIDFLSFISKTPTIYRKKCEGHADDVLVLHNSYKMFAFHYVYIFSELRRKLTHC